MVFVGKVLKLHLLKLRGIFIFARINAIEIHHLKKHAKNKVQQYYTFKLYSIFKGVSYKRVLFIAFI